MLDQARKHFKLPNSSDPLKKFKDTLFLTQVFANYEQMARVITKNLYLTATNYRLTTVTAGTAQEPAELSLACSYAEEALDEALRTPEEANQGT